jgi:hypothetical protein
MSSTAMPLLAALHAWVLGKNRRSSTTNSGLRSEEGRSCPVDQGTRGDPGPCEELEEERDGGEAMNDPHDPNRTADISSSSADSFVFDLAAGFAKVTKGPATSWNCAVPCQRNAH